MSFRTVEVICLDDSDDEGAVGTPRITQMMAPVTAPSSKKANKRPTSSGVITCSSSAKKSKLNNPFPSPKKSSLPSTPSVSYSASSSQSVTPSPPVDANNSNSTNNNSKPNHASGQKLTLAAPVRATNVSQIFPNFKTQPRQALDELFNRYSASLLIDDATDSGWFRTGQGSAIHQLPGLVLAGAPVILPLQTTYGAVSEPLAHLHFLKYLTPPEPSSAQLFAPQSNVLECPADKITLINQDWNALLEGSIGAESCCSLLGVHADQLLGPNSTKNYTVAVSMKLQKAFFQYSPLSNTQVQQLISTAETTSTSSSSSNTNITTQNDRPTCGKSQLTIPIGSILLFVPSLYTGGTIWFSQKVIKATTTATTTSSSTAATHSPPMETAIDIAASDGGNHFQYRYVAWSSNADATFQTNIQVGNLISGCRLCLLYTLETVIESEMEIKTLSSSIPSFFRCKLYRPDVPTFIQNVVQDWNSSIPIIGESSDIAHPDQYSLVLLPKDHEKKTKNPIQELLRTAIVNGSDLDFLEGTVTYKEKGSLQPNNSSQWASTSSVSMELKVSITSNMQRTWTIDNNIRTEFKNFFNNVRVKKVSGDIGINKGLRTRDATCFLVWPRRRTWMVFQSMDGSTGVKPLKSFYSYSFSEYLSYITKTCMHVSIPAQLERNKMLLTELLEWWACSNNCSSLGNLFLNEIVKSKNSGAAKVYVDSFFSKTYFEKISSSFSSLNPISSLLTHTSFLHDFPALVSEDNILCELSKCQLRHAVQLALKYYKNHSTGKTNPDNSVLLDALTFHVVTQIINEKHQDKNAWYALLRTDLVAMQHDSETFLCLLQLVSNQINKKISIRDYAKLSADLSVAIIKATHTFVTNFEKIGTPVKIIDFLLLVESFPTDLVHKSLVAIVQVTELNMALKLVHAVLSQSLFFNWSDQYGHRLAFEMINKIVLKKVTKYSIDPWNLVNVFFTRYGSDPTAPNMSIEQSFSIPSFLKLLCDEALKGTQIMDTSSKAGLVIFLQVFATKNTNNNATGFFSRLFNNDMKLFTEISNMIGQDHVSALVQKLTQSFTIAANGKFTVDLIRSVLDSAETTSNQSTLSTSDFGNSWNFASALLETFLAYFSGHTSPEYISELSKMLNESSTSQSSLPKNTISTVIEFLEKAEGKIDIKQTFKTSLPTFFKTILVVLAHDSNNKIKIKIEGERCLAQRIISKADIESMLKIIGVDRIVDFFEEYCASLPLASAMSFISDFCLFSSKKRVKTAVDENKRVTSSVHYLALLSVDALFSNSPEILIDTEMNLLLKLLTRVVSYKTIMASTICELDTSFEMFPIMSPGIILSSVCSLLTSQTITDSNKSSGTVSCWIRSMVTSAYDLIKPTNLIESRDQLQDATGSSLMLTFMKVICEAWFHNWTEKKNFPTIDKFINRESLQDVINYLGYDPVASSICKLIDSFSKKGVIPDILIYYLFLINPQKQRLLLPSFVSSLLLSTSPNEVSKEKWTVVIILLAKFKEENEIDLQNCWVEAVGKLSINPLLPEWQKLALGTVDSVHFPHTAKEVVKEDIDIVSESTTEGNLATHRIVIPDGVQTGQEFTVSVENRLFKVICPTGHIPGMTLSIRIPKKSSQTLSADDPTYYELELPPDITSEQVFNVKVKNDTVVKVRSPREIISGMIIRFALRQNDLTETIQAYAGKPADLKPPSTTTNATKSCIVDPWTYLRNLITASIGSQPMIKMLDYAEIFLYSNNERSVQAASFFSEIVQHVLDVEKVGATATTPPLTSLPSIVKSYRILDIENLSVDELNTLDTLPREFYNFFLSHCIQRAKIQIAQSKHKKVVDFVKRNHLPLTHSFYREGGRYWHVELVKTRYVDFDSGGVNVCSCGKLAGAGPFNFLSWPGPCQATILNPDHPLPEKNKAKPVSNKKTIDISQVKSLLTHFQNITKGLEIESEIEIVAPPQRDVPLVELLE